MSWRPDTSKTYHNIGIGLPTLPGIPPPMPDIVCETMCRSKNAMVCEKEFFSGACYTCAAVPSVTKARLQRCSGCQLVSYCNKNCQAADWKIHKIVCKKFPLENGKNVIVRKTESIGKDHRKKQPGTLYDLFQTAMWELQISVFECRGSLMQFTRGVGKIFLSPRVCGVCHEARPEMLFDCRCCASSYCSKEHRMQDTHHLAVCDLLYGCAMANWYLTQHHQLQIPDGLLSEVNLNDGLKFEKVSKLHQYSSEKWLETIVNLINERLSFPLTIHHALKNLKLGEQRKTLSECATLTIHIVQMTPMLDPRIWEFFLHQLPNLKKLNLSFINGEMKLDTPFNSCLLPIERCFDCNRKQRIIKYSIHPMHYHEYFSTDDYVKPDVVAVFGTSQELMDELKEKTRKNIDKAHIFTSQRNMTNSKHTVVILTDFVKVYLEACVKKFHDVRPVNILLPVQKNPVSGFCTSRVQNTLYNLRYNLCCIQGKD